MRYLCLLLLFAISLRAQGEENFCNGLNPEDTRICKILINDFESIRQQSTGNATNLSTAREMELTSELEQSRQRENELGAQLRIVEQREAEANTRLRLALQTERDLKLKLELSDLRETEINLAGLKNLQNNSNYNNIKLKLSVQEINYLASIELRLLTSLENMNKTLTTCEQNLTKEKSLQSSTTLSRELTEAKSRLGIIQENLDNTIEKLENCQSQYSDAKSQLAILKYLFTPVAITRWKDKTLFGRVQSNR
ncbi:hypothetical protein B566_EDAN017362 [Ephemera danica]|nr:hypothetical protein B566_EDAN017362 [Ephemera danica]